MTLRMVGASKTGKGTPELALRIKGRAQVLWMVEQARQAAKYGRADEARWWSEAAVRALLNLN